MESNDRGKIVGRVTIVKLMNGAIQILGINAQSDLGST